MIIEMKREKTYLFSFLLAPVFGAVMILFLMLDAAVSGFASDYAVNLNRGIIERFEEAQQEADVSVVMLGNSRMRYASTFGFDPEDIVDMPDGRKMAVLKFASNAAEFKIYSGVTDMILAAKPDYVVVMDMLLTNMRPPEQSIFLRYSKMVYEAWLEKLKGWDPKEEWTNDRHELELSCYDSYDLRLVNRRIESTAVRDRHSLDPEINSNREIARDFIAKANNYGIKVIIIHLPSNRDVLDEYGVPYYYIDSYGLDHAPDKEELLPALYDQVTWLSYPESEGRSAYCDFLHLNPTGREAFSQWFLEQI